LKGRQVVRELLWDRHDFLHPDVHAF
jgi:hypothetical protein